MHGLERSSCQWLQQELMHKIQLVGHASLEKRIRKLTKRIRDMLQNSTKHPGKVSVLISLRLATQAKSLLEVDHFSNYIFPEFHNIKEFQTLLISKKTRIEAFASR
jgi:lipid A disaccharide synthetase